MEKSRNGKQTPDFANSPLALGPFLLQYRSHRLWLHGSEAHELWFTGQNPSRSCTVEYLFPEPSHLLTSFKAYQNNLKLTSYLDSLLPHLQVLGTGIPAHLPVSTPSLLTVLCCQAAMQGVFAPLNSLSYTAVK